MSRLCVHICSVPDTHTHDVYSFGTVHDRVKTALHLTRRYLSLSTASARQSYMCDVILVAADGDTELPAHRAALVAAAPFLRERLNARPLPAHVVLDGVSAAALPVVVQYLYTGRVAVAAATVNAVLEAAAALRLPALREHCLDWLRHRLLRADTCLAVRRLAVCHGSDALRGHADAYIGQHSGAVVRTPQFRALLDGMPLAEMQHTLAEATATTATADVCADDDVENGVCNPRDYPPVPSKVWMMVVDSNRAAFCLDFEAQQWFEVPAKPTADR